MATTTDTQSLTAAQKEFVAVGASVGAGCHPCVSHHLEAGADAGLEVEQLLAAVTTAEHITAEAAVLMGNHARSKLGPPVATPAELPPLEAALAALGASLSANDASAIDLQMRTAHDFGATHAQLEQAIETAKTVQENASRIHVSEARRVLASFATPASASETEADAGGCGCNSDDDPEAASHAQGPATEGTGAQDETPTGFRPPMAEYLHAAASAEEAGPAAMIAHCRQMFGHMFGPPDAPIETKKAEPWTASRGCSGIQEV